MTRFIKAEDAEPYLTRYIPSVEAVERSKIDKAIEEIKQVSFKHRFELGEYIGEETVTWEVVKLDHVLNILKRNIEEENNV